MMRSPWLIIGGLLALLLITQRRSIMNTILPWKRARNAEKYLPMLRVTEIKYGIPEDLLARIAYQESRWRDDIVNGATKSAAGAVGLMQIVPRWHPDVDPLNVPIAIDYAGKFLRGLYRELGSWKLATAAYNTGARNVRDHGGIPPFPETQKYVREIYQDLFAAVPDQFHGAYA